MIVAKVNPTQYETLREALASEGVLISGNTGVIAKDGVRAEYRYDGTEQLTVTVTHSPFIVPRAMAERQIADGLRQQGVDCTVQG